MTNSLGAAVDVLSRARTLLPALFVHLAASPVTYVRLLPEEVADIPDERSWQGARYDYGDENDFGDGTVWIVGEGEDLRVHEYIRYNGVLHGYNTTDATGSVFRQLVTRP